ncbi:MAG: hypothetical protein J1F01_01990 [Oscillospiraceae bacterium]|nr:hypothetical protein [Oscillospiraceae bacterium]
MSKKNRRKTLTKKEGMIRKGEFRMDDSKIYIILTIVMFHILPLALVMLGEKGQEVLLMSFLVMLNPIFIALTGLIYGIRKGYNSKYPLFMGVIASISIPMYYNFETNSYMMQTLMVMAVVYIAFSFVSTAVGAFIKKLMNL